MFAYRRCRSEEAAQLGMGVSLFRRLTEAHPRSVCRLCQQYRMAADVMEPANELVYGGQLRCGSEAVAFAKLVLPQLDFLLQLLVLVSFCTLGTEASPM